jgi:hypothetical protein
MTERMRRCREINDFALLATEFSYTFSQTSGAEGGIGRWGGEDKGLIRLSPVVQEAIYTGLNLMNHRLTFIEVRCDPRSWLEYNVQATISRIIRSGYLYLMCGGRKVVSRSSLRPSTVPFSIDCLELVVAGVSRKFEFSARPVSTAVTLPVGSLGSMSS